MHEAKFAFWSDDTNLNQSPDAMKPFFQAARAVFIIMARDGGRLAQGKSRPK